MGEHKRRKLIMLINVLVIALLIGSNIYFYNKNISLHRDIKIIGNMFEAEKERQIGINIGENVPNKIMQTLDGVGIPLVPSKGQLSVVIFFESTCEPCKKQLKDLQTLANNGQISSKINLLAVTKEQSEVIKKFISREKLTFPVVSDADGLISEFRISQYPFTYIINSHGLVEIREAGYEKSSVVNETITKILESGELQ